MTPSDAHDDQPPAQNLERLTENLKKVEALSQRLIGVMTNRTTHNTALDGPKHDLDP